MDVVIRALQALSSPYPPFSRGEELFVQSALSTLEAFAFRAKTFPGAITHEQQDDGKRQAR